MKTFYCDHCGSLVFFENVSCVGFGHALGFLSDVMDMAALAMSDGGQYQSLASASGGRHYRMCANGREHAVCNWYVPAEEENDFCTACRLNDTIPDVSRPENLGLWHK